jgi:molybdate transport system substrate-binding protein
MVSGHVVSGSARSLGDVKTGIAIKTGEAHPAVSTPAELKTALLAATSVYFPDPVKATAGIHFFNVLKQLGIDTELAPRLRTYPNGATAMQAMAKASEVGAIGCTQVTEINFTPGVDLIDVLPKAFELATRYVAAVSSQAKEPAAAHQLISLLTGAENADLRQSLGFE